MFNKHHRSRVSDWVTILSILLITVSSLVAQESGVKKEKNYRFKQYESMDFYRTFRVGDSVKSEDISAKLTNGVLTVHLPKSDAVKPRKIEVKKQ